MSLQRKDIETLKTILLAVERVERKGEITVQAAENLDALYTALRSQVRLVCENEALEELSDENPIH